VSELHIELPVEAFESVLELQLDFAEGRVTKGERDERFLSIITRYCNRLPLEHETMYLHPQTASIYVRGGEIH